MFIAMAAYDVHYGLIYMAYVDVEPFAIDTANVKRIPGHIPFLNIYSVREPLVASERSRGVSQKSAHSATALQAYWLVLYLHLTSLWTPMLVMPIYQSVS